jgi:EpsI family protein
MQSSLMEDHVVYGWLVFAAAMPLFFFLAGRIERADAARGTVVIRPAVPVVRTPPVHLVALATGAALAGPALWLLLGSSQPAPLMAAAPPGVAATPLSPVTDSGFAWRPAFTGEQVHRAGTAVVDGMVVQVDRFVYGAQSQDAEMIGGDNVIAPDSVVAGQGMIGPLDDNLRMAREVLVRTDDSEGRVVWYWYSVAGVETGSSTKAKLLELWSFLRRTPSSEIVVVSAPCANGECRAARAALYRATTGRDMPAPAAR